MHVGEVGQQPGLVLHVAQQDDGVAMSRLEDGRQRQRLVGPAAGVAEHEVIALPDGRLGQGRDRAGEEWIRDVADDRAEKHRRGPAKASGEWIRSVAELARREGHALPCLGRDRHARRNVIEHARDGALGDAGCERDVAHRGSGSRSVGAR